MSDSTAAGDTGAQPVSRGNFRLSRETLEMLDRWEAQLDVEREALRAAGVSIDEDEVFWTAQLSPEAIARLDAIEGLDVPPEKRMTAAFGTPSRLALVPQAAASGTAWDVALETPLNDPVAAKWAIANEALVNEVSREERAGAAGWRLRRPQPKSPDTGVDTGL